MKGCNDKFKVTIDGTINTVVDGETIINSYTDILGHSPKAIDDAIAYMKEVTYSGSDISVERMV